MAAKKAAEAEGKAVGAEATVEAGLSRLDRFVSEVGEEVVPGPQKEGSLEERRRQDVEAGVKELIESIAGSKATLVDGRSTETLRRTIAAMDEKIAAQVKEILHDEDFRDLEGRWRGLKYLVANTRTDSKLKIKVLNVAEEELFDDLKENQGRWQQSRLFDLVYREDYDTWGGEPFGALVGDFHFDQSQESLEQLGDIAKVAAAAHAPFISSVSERFFGKRSWEDVKSSVSKDVSSHLGGKEYASWREFREKDDAKYVGLTLPRVLARRPWKQSGTGTEGGFAFEEAEAGQYADEYVWMNAAYPMAVNINRSVTEHGWATSIRGPDAGGAVDGLPLHTFETEDGGVDARSPTDITISETFETALSDNGFLALSHKKNSTTAAFIGGQSAYKPKTYATDPDATASEKLAARLPYNFAVSRISHYLKAIGRQMIGQGMEEGEIESKLNDWISQYVLANPQDAPPSRRAQKPLKDAKVAVTPVEGAPGSYAVQLRMRPHYQIEDLNVDVTLVAAVEK